MIEVEVSQLVPSRSGLRFGFVVRYGEGGPVRFADATLPWSAIARGDRARIMHEFNRIVDDDLAAEPLF